MCFEIDQPARPRNRRVVRRRILQTQPQKVATRMSPPHAMRCRARTRCPRSSQSTAAGKRSQAADLAGPSLWRRTSHIELRRNRRTHAWLAADSDADRTDDYRRSATRRRHPHRRLARAFTFAHTHAADCSTLRGIQKKQHQ
jgi:hypothetical protein